MALVSDIIPALIGGVSQQSPATRTPGKAELLTNGLPSVVEGLIKRPPSKHVATLINYGVGENYARPFVHWINRDSSERYTVLIEDGAIRVFDREDGAEKSVTMDPDTDDYIASLDARTDLGAISIGDTTIVWNRTVEVANGSATAPAATNSALIYVRQPAYGKRYSVTVNGTEYYYLTPSGIAARDSILVGTDAIARVLVEGASALGSLYTGFVSGTDDCAAPSSGLNTLSGFTVTRKGSVILLERATPFTILSDDGQGGAGLTVITDSAARFSDLPAKAFDGYRVRIGKQGAEAESDYYLEYDDSAGDNRGVWKEIVGPGVNLGLDASTMPHALTRNSDGTFTFSQIDWKERGAGDTTSAPDPTFVGKTVSEILYTDDRLVICGGEDPYCSAARDIFRFYRASAAVLADDDPFGISPSTQQVTPIRNVSDVAGRLVVFSDESQLHLVRSSELFVRGGVSLKQAAKYTASPICRPVNLGTSLLFTYDSGGYSAFAEYTVTGETTATVSTEVSYDIPKYVPAGVALMSACPAHTHVVAFSPNEPSNLYNLRYFENEGRKVQLAWFKWEFPEDMEIMSFHFTGSALDILFHREDVGLFLERIDVAPYQTDAGSTWLTRLDGRLTEADTAPAYNSGTGRTVIALPYNPTGVDLVVAARPGGDDPAGFAYEIVSRNSSSVTVAGVPEDQPFYIGRPYEFHFRFSPFYVRDDGQAQNGSAIIDGRLQLADVAVAVSPGTYITATVTSGGRTPREKEWSGLFGSSPDTLYDALGREVSAFRFKVLADGSKAVIDLQSDSHLPCELQQCQWRGNFTPKARLIQ